MIVRRGDPEPQVLSVPGNVEPEAFSLSGDALFVIDFVPPLAPERYRVARLDLARGPVDDVRSNEEELQEPMRGTARAPRPSRPTAVASTRCTRATRRRTSRRRRSCTCSTSTPRHASCVDLPPEFATDPLGAVAVTPSGTPPLRVLARPRARSPSSTRRRSRSRAPGPCRRRSGTVPASVRATATESTLYLSVFDQITSVALDDLTAGDWAIAPGEITGIEPATDGSSLYVVLADRVLVVDPRTFVPPAGGRRPTGVGPGRPRGAGAAADLARLREVRLLTAG